MQTLLLFTLFFSFGLQANDDYSSTPLKDTFAEQIEKSTVQSDSQNRSLDSEKLESLIAKAEGGDIHAQKELGDRYLVSENHEKAFYWFYKAALQGDAKSQDQIGEMYFSGLGVEQDEQKAIFWFERASHQNYRKAQETLRTLRLLGRDIDSLTDKGAMELYKLESLMSIRNSFIEGLDVAEIVFLDYLEYQMSPFQIVQVQDQVLRQFREEVKTEREAEEKEIEMQQRKIGEQKSIQQLRLFNSLFPLNVEENRFPQNIKYSNVQTSRELQMLTEGASNGDVNSQYHLGMFYLSLQTPDYTEAIYWFERAAQSGHLEAQYEFGVLLYLGHGSPRNYMKAIGWIKKAAYRGHIKAQLSLGMIYLNGRGTALNNGKGIFWLEKSAQGGSEIAQYKLTRVYFLGNGAPRSYMEAYKWGILAKAQGVFVDEVEAILNEIEKRLPPSKIIEAQHEATRYHRFSTKNLKECY